MNEARKARIARIAREVRIAREARIADTLHDWYAYISSESKEGEATELLERERWYLDAPGIRTCPNPHCRSSHTVPSLDKAATYRCLSCDKRFSVRTGTEYDDGRPLWRYLLDLGYMLHEADGLSREEAATKMFEEFKAKRYEPLKCPRQDCGSLEVSEVDGPAPYYCHTCHEYFSARTETALKGGRIPLDKWLDVIICYGDGGRPTSVKLAKMLGITQNMAWGYREALAKAFAEAAAKAAATDLTTPQN